MTDEEPGVEEPTQTTTPAVSPVQRIRAELAEAGIAARRMLPRVRLAWLVIVAVAQVVIAFVGWRIWVWRGRPRLK
jgi:hypothetical protein